MLETEKLRKMVRQEIDMMKQEMAIKMDYYCHEVAESVSQPQSKSIEFGFVDAAMVF